VASRVNCALYVETSDQLTLYTGELPDLTSCQGWFAESKGTESSTGSQIHIKPPGGEYTQVTFYSTATQIYDTEQANPEGYSPNPEERPIPPNGECMFAHNGQRHLVSLTTEPKFVNSTLGTAFFCGQWFVQIGETLFIVNQPVVYVNKNDETCADKTPCYTSIQQAINTSSDGTVIKIVEGNYEENITLNTSKTLTLKGWYDSTFTTQALNTTIKGSFVVSNGKIRTSKIKVHFQK